VPLPIDGPEIGRSATCRPIREALPEWFGIASAGDALRYADRPGA